MGKIIIFLVTLYSFVSASFFEVDHSKLNDIGKTFGKKALQRLQYVQKQLDIIEQEKLSYAQIYMVNALINRISYKKDKVHWKSDYIPTALDFVTSGAGDSLDFAAAKYTILVNLGFDPERFQFFKTDVQGMNHLKYDTNNYYVLGYSPKNTKEYIILDCYSDKIVPAFRKKLNLKPSDITLRKSNIMLRDMLEMKFVQNHKFLDIDTRKVNSSGKNLVYKR